MRTTRLRYSGLGILLLVLIAGLLLAWLRLSHPVFATVAIAVFFLVLFVVGWDGWRQTSPSHRTSCRPETQRSPSLR
jgi:uncharacterized membrane protein YccC